MRIVTMVSWIAFLVSCFGVTSVLADTLSMIAVSPHVKILPNMDLPKTRSNKVELRAWKNEYVCGQAALFASANMDGVKIELSVFRNKKTGKTLPKSVASVAFVGFIPVRKNSPVSREDRLVAKAPCEIPDPIMDWENVSLRAGRYQPVWITVRVPKRAAAGTYTATLRASCAKAKCSIPVRLEVLPLTLPDERHLYVTNWFSIGNIARSHGVDMWSEEFWTMLAKYARIMAEHRQNVFWISPRYVSVTRKEDGTLGFDFSRFDRFIDTFMKAGVNGRIELQHVCGLAKGWGSPVVFRGITAKDEKTGKNVSLNFEEGMVPLLQAIQKHLETRGLIDKTMIHIVDEPTESNLASWRAASARIHQVVPKIKRIEAIETEGFDGELEVWVPKLNHLRNWLAHYKKVQAEGAELWFYTCCHPFGYYPNRFLDDPLADVRLLHWLNWKYRLDGYLHWGLNMWHGDPFGPPRPNLPPGDTHIIYPGKKGPLSSIRFDMMREGLEDYEKFLALTQRIENVKKKLGAAASDFPERQRSDEICNQLVVSLSTCIDDPESVDEIVELLDREAVAVDERPLFLLASDPPAGTELVPGPIVVRFYGVVETGAKVRCNGHPITIVNGRFSFNQGIGGSGEVKFEVESKGKKKTVVRRFRIRGAEKR